MRIFPRWMPVKVLMLILYMFVFGTKITLAESWQNQFQEYIEQHIKQDHIPGGALALIQGQEIILATGYGMRDVAANLPVDKDTLFHIGSTQKSMTALMIATLVDGGQMHWDSPIISDVPSFYLSDPDATERVTIRHLLSMRGGIPDDAEGSLPDHVTPKDVLRAVGKTPLLAMPGEVFSYSNLSSSAAGYLGVLAWGGNGENLYGDFARLLQLKILDPIGMATATIKHSEALANPNYSKSYVLSSRGVPVLSPSYDFEGDALAPSGSLKANVYEMALYVATQMNGGIAPNGTRIVSRQQSKEMFIPYLENYAMGWEIIDYEDAKIVMHNGSFDDYASVIGFLPGFDIGFVLLLNSESAGDSLIEDAPYALADLLSQTQ